jgi:predicted XRE-type DNA-binding protein
MESAAIETHSNIRRVERTVEPTVLVKLSLMRQISLELKRRYGTQKVAADAMEMYQSDISELYNEQHHGFSIVFLIQLAAKLNKRVTVTVA